MKDVKCIFEEILITF